MGLEHKVCLTELEALRTIIQKFVRWTVPPSSGLFARSAEIKLVQERDRVMDNDQLEHISFKFCWGLSTALNAVCFCGTAVRILSLSIRYLTVTWVTRFSFSNEYMKPECHNASIQKTWMVNPPFCCGKTRRTARPACPASRDTLRPGWNFSNHYYTPCFNDDEEVWLHNWQVLTAILVLCLKIIIRVRELQQDGSRFRQLAGTRWMEQLHTRQSNLYCLSWAFLFPSHAHLIEAENNILFSCWRLSRDARRLEPTLRGRKLTSEDPQFSMQGRITSRRSLPQHKEPQST